MIANRRDEQIIDDLIAIVGARHVLVGEDVRSRWDGYPPNHPMEALCIVRPANTREVSAILAYCHGQRVTVVDGAR